MADAISFVNTRSRPWIDSGKESALEDPFTISAIGDLEVRIYAADALLTRAAQRIDKGLATPTEEIIAATTIATAEVNVLTTEVSILATNKLFELAGARSILSTHTLDRHWRNARAHALHDSVRWKYFHIGNYYLNDANPPRHPWF